MFKNLELTENQRVILESVMGTISLKDLKKDLDIRRAMLKDAVLSHSESTIKTNLEKIEKLNTMIELFEGE